MLERPPGARDPIVVGTDGSTPARQALEWAADDADRRDRPLHIVHVMDRRRYDTSLYRSGVTDIPALRGRQILNVAEELALRRWPGIQVTTELARYPTAHVFQERSKHAFETVLGHRGLGGFASLLLGSTGLRAAGHAFGPIVIVRGQDTAGHGEIVAGIDLSEDSAAVLEYAFGAAAVRGARLRIVHAWRPPDYFLRTVTDVNVRTIEENLQWRVIQAHATMRKCHPGVEVIDQIVRGHAVQALTSATHRASLLVVGAHGDGALGFVHLGAVGHGVIHHSHCPVAVVRPRV